MVKTLWNYTPCKDYYKYVASVTTMFRKKETVQSDTYSLIATFKTVYTWAKTEKEKMKLVLCGYRWF